MRSLNAILPGASRSSTHRSARSVTSSRFLAGLKALLLSVVLAVVLGPSAFAQQNNIWLGTTTAWSTASNWSLNAVPTTAHNVRIPRRANAATLSAASVARTITFIDSLATGTASIVVGTQTLTVGTGGAPGDITINNNGALSISTGTVTLSNAGSMTLNTGGSITMSGAGTIAVNGSWTNNGGTMSNTAGTVSFTGSGQTIGGTNSTTFPTLSIGATAGTYTMNSDNSATAVTFVAGAATSTLALGGTSQLTVTGAVTMNPSATTGFNKVLDVGDGTLTAASLTMATSANDGRDCILQIGGGSATISGNVTMNSAVARHHIDWTGTGTLYVGGNMTGGGLTTGGNGTVEYNGTGAQTAGGAYTYNNLVINKSANTATIGGNTTVIGDLTIQSGDLTFGAFTTSVTGLTTIDGTLTISSTTGTKTFGNVLMNSGSTWNSTAAETYAINGDLTVAGGTITGTATGIFSVSGSFSVPSGTTSLGQATITVTGTTDIAGTLDITSATGTKTFIGKVTVDNGASWNNSANSAIVFRGGIENNGTFAGGTGTNTFNTNSQTISGSSPLSFGAVVAITGAITLTNQNSAGVTVGTNLTGSVAGSTWLNDVNSSLSVGGTLLATGTLTASADGNTVDYAGGGAQTIKATTYHHLTLSNAGAKTAGGALTVNGDLTIDGAATFNGGTSLTHNFGGNWTVNTSAATPFTFTTASTINFNTPASPAATSIDGTTTATLTFNDININNTSGVNLNENISFSAGGTPTLTVGAGATLTPAAGVTLTSTGTLTGSGTVKVTRTAATADFNTQYAITTKTLTALTVVYDATSAQSVNTYNYFNLSISGDRGGSTVTFPAASVGVSGTFDPNAANVTYVMTGNTINFNGAGPQTIPAFNYNNLTSSSTGARTLASSGTIGVAGVFTPGANSYTITGSTVDFNGTGAQTIPAFNYNNLTVSGSRTTNNVTLVNGGTIGIAGDFSPTATFSSGGYVIANNTVNYNGTSAQVVAGFSYNNLTLSNTSAPFTQSSGFNVAGTMTVGGGAVFSPDVAVVINTPAAAGTLTGSGTITVTRTAATPDLISQYKFSSYTLANLLVDYTATAAQTVNALNYGTLTISGSRGASNVTLAGTGTIGISGALNLTASFSSGGYVTTGSTVSYNGSSAQTAVAFNYHNLTIANAAGVAMGGNVSVSGTPTLTSGTFSIGANTLTFNGEPIAGNEANLSAGATSSLVFNGTASFLTIPSHITDLKNLTVNVSPGSNKVYHYGGVLTIHTLLTLTDGILDKIGGVSGIVSIPSTGTITRTSGRIRGSLQQYIPAGNSQPYFPIGGNDLLTPVEVSFVGVSVPGTLTAAMTFGDHPNIATSGIDLNKSANRRFTLTPSGLTFTSFDLRLGQGGTPPDIDEGATPTNFIMRRYDGASWYKTTTGARTDTSCAATGLTAFGDFQVGEQLVKTWDGGAGTSTWGDANNWAPDGVPTALEDVLLNSSITVNINTAATTNSLTLNNNGLVVTIQSGQSLAVTKDFTLTSGTLNTQAAFPSVTGTVSMPGGTVGYTAASGPQTVVVQSYPSLTISGGGTKTLAGTITPTGNLTISGGTFDMGTFTANRLSAGGTWTVANGATVIISGTNTRPANYNTHSIGETSTIEYAGTDQTIGALNTSQSYGNLTLSGSGTKSFPAGTTGIMGAFTITGVSVATAGSTIDYNGSSGQTVRALDYNNLAFSTSGTKTFAAGTTRIAGSFTIGGTATADATTNAATIEYNGTSAQTVAAFVYRDLAINNASGVTLGGNVTVNNVLTLTSGTVTTTGAFTLTIATTGSVSRTSGHIIGKLAKTVSAGSPNPTFEVGGVGRYAPVDLSFAGVTNPGTLTVSTTAGDHFQIITSGIDGAKSVNRYWTLSNSGIAFVSYDATFNFESAEVDGGANPNNFILGLYNGSSWTLPAVGTLTSTSSQATGLADFGDFQIGEADAGSTKTWDGGAGTDNWGDANNWNPNGVPIATDNINLNGANTININVAAVCNSITLNNTGLTLTVQSTRSLTVSGNFTLTNGTFNTEAGFPTVNGTVSITGGTVGYSASSGTQNISEQDYFNLNLSNGATKVFNGAYGIAGDFTVSGGTVDATTNTTIIEFNGTGSQAVAAIDYRTLVFNNGGTRTFAAGTVRIREDFNVTAGSATAVTNSTAVEFNSSTIDQYVAAIDYYDLTFSNAVTRIFGTGTTKIAGSFTVGGGSVTTAGTTIEYNGTGTQGVAAINYNNLTFSSTGTRVVASGTTAIAGNFTVSGGATNATTNSTTFNFNGSGNQAIAAINYHNLTVSNNGGTKTFASGTTGIAGNFVVTAGSINTTANSTTIDFNGSGSQAVAAINYHHLTFSNSGTKTFASGTVGIAGNFTVSGGSAVTAGTTIDFNGTGTQNVAVVNFNNLTFSNTGTRVFGNGSTGIAGNFTVSGGSANTTTNTATLDFNGAGTQAVAAINYYNLTFSNGGTKRFASGTSRIAAAFSITEGTADATTNTPTIEYNGSGVQTLQGIAYHNLTINNSAGTTASADVAVSGTLNFIAGTIATGSYKATVTSTGTVTRTSGHVIGNLEKYIPTIGPTKTFEIGTGSDYTPVDITFASVSTPNYLTVSTATGDHAQISSSTIEPLKTANRTWTLTNSGVVFTTYDVTFNFVSGDLDPAATPNNFIVGRTSGGTWTYPTVGTKTSTSTQATGLTSGQFGDFQLGELAGVTKTWDGGALTNNWGDGDNWDPNGVPTSADNVDLTGANTIDVNVAGATNSLLLNNSGLVLTILSGNSLTVSGNLTVANGTLNTQASFPSVAGSVSLNGGEIGYVSSGAQTISAQTYNRLTLANSGTKTAGGALTVNSTFTIDGAATFAAGTSLTHTFKGDWVVNTSAGTPFSFVTSSTLNFNTPSPAASRSLSGTSSATLGFNTVNVNNTSGLDANLNFSASGTLTVGTAATLTPGPSNTISGAGTLTGTGTVKVTKTSATPDFSSQYTITNKTLTNLTVDYAGTGQQLSNLTYGALRVSGSITGATNTATVGSMFTVTGTFTPTGGTVTMNAGSSIVNSGGTLTFWNLTASSGTVTTSSTFAVAGALTVNAATTFSASSGTITMAGGSSIANSNALTFSGITIGSGSAVTTASSFTVSGALTVQGSATFAPSGGTITMSNGSSISNSGSLTFRGLTIPASATVTTSSSFAMAAVLTVGSGATFSPSAGTVTMNNGSSVSNSGTLAFKGLSVAASATVTASGDMTVGSTLAIGSGATFTPSGSVTVNGDVSNSGSQTGTGTIILAGGASAHDLSGGGSFTNLELSDTQGATLSASTTINGTLTLTTGTIATGANKVTISATGSVTRTGGHVAGYLEKRVSNGSSSRTFEIGDASNYTPVDIAFSGVTGGGGFVTVNTTGGDHPNIATSNIDPSSSANRYWTISSAISFGSIDATFNFVSGDVDGGADPQQFIVGRYSGSWSYPTVGTKTSTSTQATGVTALGDFQLGQQFGGTFTSTATGGNWSSSATWAGNQVPTLGADVVIATTGGNFVTIDENTANLRSVTINSGAILQGGGAYILSIGADGGNDLVNDGTFTSNNVTVRLNKNSQWSGSGTFTLRTIDLNSKTLTLAFSAPNTVSLSAPGDPFVNAGTLSPGSNSTIEYNGTSGQSISSSGGISFHHLRITNSATVTLQKNLTASNLTGDLTITSGGVLNTSNGSTAFEITGSGGATLTIGSASTLNVGGAGSAASSFPGGFGTLSVDPSSTIQYSNSSGVAQTVSATPSYGNILFTGSGAKNLGSGSFSIAGNWTNNSTGGSLNTGTSTVTVTGSSKVIGGTGVTTFASLNVSGTYTNNATTQINTALGGSGSLTQGSSSTLNLNFGGSIALTSLDASASGNTVNYQFAGSQSVRQMSYVNLTLSGSGTKTLASGTTSVSGILTVTSVTVDALTNSSTVNFNGSGNQDIAAFGYYNLTLSNGGIKYFPGSTTQIAGSLLINDLASANTLDNSSTVEFNGTTAQTINGLTFYNLVLSNSGVKTFSTATTTNANLMLNAGATMVVDVGVELQIGGDFTVDGSVTNNGTINVGF